MVIRPLAFLTLLTGVGFRPAAAQRVETPPPHAVDSLVREDVARRWNVAPGDLTIEWGALPLGVVIPTDSRVSLRGEGRGGWFVVALHPADGPAFSVRFRAGTIVEIARASRALPRGHRLTADDLEAGERLAWGAPQTGPGTDVIGWEVRAPLSAGDVLAAPAVIEPAAVSSGQEVELVWTRGGVSVAFTGVALYPANAGQPVRVRLPDGRGVARGRVIAPGTVRLDTDWRTR